MDLDEMFGVIAPSTNKRVADRDIHALEKEVAPNH